MQLAEKFLECRELFKKHETRGDLLNPTISHVMGIVFGKIGEMQQNAHDEVMELTKNIETKVLKPLNDYQVRFSSFYFFKFKILCRRLAKLWFKYVYALFTRYKLYHILRCPYFHIKIKILYK